MKIKCWKKSKNPESKVDKNKITIAPKLSEEVKETKFFNEELGLREEVNQENNNTTNSNKYKWTNRQRVLVIASRGISHSERILMNNVISLLPHSKKKWKLKEKLLILI